MRRSKFFSICLFTITLCMATGCAAKKDSLPSGKSLLNPDKPVSISVWNYYNGAQQDVFNRLVDEFNEGEGKSLGVIVEPSSIGNVSDLEKSVLASIDGEVGAKEIPNIFAAYADTAYAVDAKKLVVDISQYLTEEEEEAYIESYMDEGRFSSEDSIKIFPVAKAAEVFMVNKTDWEKFAQSTGTSLTDISTIEGVTETAKKYYEWTDSLTETPNDGQAFFGRDALANYFIIGAKQLGTEILSVKDGVPSLDFEKKIIRKLWDNYYTPYISGYFSAVGKFRSDDIKTGTIISFVGSSAGATFFPKQVARDNNTLYNIEMEALPCPQFADSEKYAVQQGAGMVVLENEDKAKVEASVAFLKWFTDTKQNVEFSIGSGYLPVKKEASKKDVVDKYVNKKDESVVKVIDASLQQVSDNELYTARAFKNSTNLRNVLEYSIADKAKADRESVKAALSSGLSLEEAIAPFVTDENFDTWYNETLTSLEDLVNK